MPTSDATVPLAGLQRGDGRLALVTGATGYVGGRLIPELLHAGWRVRALARHPDRLRGRPWRDAIEVAEGDAGDAAEVAAAMEGVDVAYYLIHAIDSGRTFEARDRRTARVFGKASREAGISRLVYLGGLSPDQEELSAHLASRREVGEILLAAGVPTAVLQAAVVIGSGSVSFEMLRHLTERLPAMVVPRWLDTRIQPIAIRDVLRYLVGAASIPPELSRGFDIGGPDVLTYRQMMQRFARIEQLRPRTILKVPVLTPRLSSHWVGLVTPVPSRFAKPLVDSLVHEVVCKEHDIAAFVPDPPDGLIGFDRAVELALQRVRDSRVSTRWTSASTPKAPSESMPSDPDWAGGSLYSDDRTCEVRASPASLWQVIEAIGGRHGWYSWSLAWRVRGWLDQLWGGPGLRRGRRDQRTLLVGDTLDFWRVEDVQEQRLLRLRAEMRLPGLAWLDLGVEPGPDGRTLLRQKAWFAPHGLAGHLYWRAVSPFHGVVFGGMQRNIAQAAEALEATGDPRRQHAGPLATLGAKLDGREPAPDGREPASNEAVGHDGRQVDGREPT